MELVKPQQSVCSLALLSLQKGQQLLTTTMFKEADKVRQLMGVCPQHDILFENLTPVEHL